ncbi:MAG TPA: DUF2505 domain-containing protein [Steroidobacteraceae bacterium]|nr:DUF2505 domain-containing protein [Steroidobacteraceae bacterium]
MDVRVKQALKADLETAFKVCTESKSLEETYAELGGTDVRIKREGRAPNVKIRVARKMPADAPAAIKRFVPAVNDVSHTEQWRREGDYHVADIEVEIKGVPVKISGTKALIPNKQACAVEWHFTVTSGVPIVGRVLAGFAAEQLQGQLEDEAAILKKMAAAR